MRRRIFEMGRAMRAGLIPNLIELPTDGPGRPVTAAPAEGDLGHRPDPSDAPGGLPGAPTAIVSPFATVTQGDECPCRSATPIDQAELGQTVKVHERGTGAIRSFRVAASLRVGPWRVVVSDDAPEGEVILVAPRTVRP